MACVTRWIYDSRGAARLTQVDAGIGPPSDELRREVLRQSTNRGSIGSKQRRRSKPATVAALAGKANHASSPGRLDRVPRPDSRSVKAIPYEDTVHEALCFGWVDSLIRRLDDDRYARKFTPRRPTSKWSDINRQRWITLKKGGLLTAAAAPDARPTDNSYVSRPPSRVCGPI